MKVSDIDCLSSEGLRGIEDLAKLCEAIGYKSSSPRKTMKTITKFLVNNPGAIEALYDFVIKRNDCFPFEEEDEEDDFDYEDKDLTI
jgi:hypothetical protein